MGMGKGNRTHDAHMRWAAIELQQTHRNARHIHLMDTMGCRQDVAIVDQSAAAEEKWAAYYLSDPWILVGAHLNAAHNAIGIGHSAGYKIGMEGAGK